MKELKTISDEKLLRQIQSGAWMTRGLDEPEDICYTEANKIVTERGESEKDTFYLSRQYLSEPNGRVCYERPYVQGRTIRAI